MSECEAIEKILGDYQRMISKYIEATPDPNVCKAGIDSINVDLMRNFREAGYSSATLTELMVGMAQITAIAFAFPELKWN